MNIEKSPVLGRDQRREPPAEFGASTWDGAREAVHEGRVADALAAIDYGCQEARSMHDSAVSLADDLMTELAKVAGDEAPYQIMRRRYEPLMQQWLAVTPGVEESVLRAVEFQRGHFGQTSVKEEEGRFVVTCDPCGSGGRLRRTKTVGRQEQPHDWTWNKADVPHYCTHCAVMWEILPTEMRGHPVRINLPPQKDNDPCVHLYYKTPEAIPQEYFDRIGRTRGTPAEAPLHFMPQASAIRKPDSE